MKQTLLLLATILTAGSAFASVPTLETDLYVQKVSPNGKWAVSADATDLTLIDVKNDDYYLSIPNYGLDYTDAGYDYNATYTVGYGNAVSNSGTIVGSSTYNGRACYWALNDDEELELHLLPVFNENSSSTAHGITPDGSRIVGYASSSSDYTQAGTIVLSTPVLWELNDNGEYEIKRLPYPAKDFMGRTPQYVIGLAISDDGKTIAAQVTCGNGFYHSPVVLREGADGEWTAELVNPEVQSHGVEFPEYHEFDGPDYPYEDSYMTEEELAAYNAAVDEWANNGYTGDYPEYADYMSAESIAAYNAAAEEYNTAYLEWYYNVYTPFWDAFDQAYYAEGGMPDFAMNVVAFSGNGNYYGATVAAGDYFSGYSYTPATFNLAKGDYKIYDNTQATVTYINDNGVVLGARTYFDGYCRRAVILTEGASDFQYLDQYIASIDEEAYDWMIDNMASPVVTGYAESDDDDDDDDSDSDFGGFGGDEYFVDDDMMLLSAKVSAKSSDDDDYLDDDMGVGDFGGFGGDDDYLDDDMGVGDATSIVDLLGDSFTYDSAILTGLPTADANLSTIYGAGYNGFYGYGINDLPGVYTFIYKMPSSESGVSAQQVVKNTLTVKALSNGTIRVTGNAKDVKVYDLSGRCVFSTSAPTATINTGLKQGSYIVRATDSLGKTAVTKAIFNK